MAPEQPPQEEGWVAVAYGALDATAISDFGDETEIVVMPVVPGQPLALPTLGASLWRRLLSGPVPDHELTEDERSILREMRDAGVASSNPRHASRVVRISAPWLTSPLHELVYALVANVARARGIPAVFIKGPVLHAQGLRKREHSGDVDIWVKPDRITELIAAMESWGWELQPDLWGDLPINHSLTIEPIAGWGCEIDVHRRLPGLALSDEEAFEVVRARTVPETFAGVEVSVPRRELNAALSAVHLMRPEIGIGTKRGAEAEAVAVLQSGGLEALRSVQVIDALHALREVLPQAFPGADLDFSKAGEPRDWYWRGERDKAHAYLLALKGVPWPRRIAIAFRLFWPAPEVVIESDSRLGGASRGVLRARFLRLRRGINSLLRSRPDSGR